MWPLVNSLALVLSNLVRTDAFCVSRQHCLWQKWSPISKIDLDWEELQIPDGDAFGFPWMGWLLKLGSVSFVDPGNDACGFVIRACGSFREWGVWVRAHLPTHPVWISSHCNKVHVSCADGSMPCCKDRQRSPSWRRPAGTLWLLSRVLLTVELSVTCGHGCESDSSFDLRKLPTPWVVEQVIRTVTFFFLIRFNVRGFVWGNLEHCDF